MARWPLLSALLPALLLASFAGCVGDDPAPHVDLTVSGVPIYAAVGEPITFNLEGTGDLSSTHVGAHYWSTSTNTPTEDFAAAGGCAHIPDGAAFPAEVQVTCTFTEAGTVYLRGHARTDDGETNFWSSEKAITVAAYTLTTDATPSAATAGEDVTFELTVAGDAATSDHLGAHYFTQDVEDATASFGDQAGACAHAAGASAVPGTFTVTCNFAAAGTYYVFGHMRLGSQANFWADSFSIVVS